MQITELEQRLADVRAQISPLRTIEYSLVQQIREARSRQFIAVNQIRREDVEFRDGPGKPWFGHVSAFINWMKEHSDKNWADWNGTIYRTSDLLNGRMPEDACGLTEHLA